MLPGRLIVEQQQLRMASRGLGEPPDKLSVYLDGRRCQMESEPGSIEGDSPASIPVAKNLSLAHASPGCRRPRPGL